MANVRKHIQELAALGPLPSEESRDIKLFEEYEKLLRAISKPITDDEAKVLIKLFGNDGSFGLASTIMHIIETAPGWPLEDCLQDQSNEWIVEMRNRCIRGGHLFLN